MKEAVLNPKIEELDKGSMTYGLYQSLVDTIERANSVDAPDFTENPPMKKDAQGNQVFDPDDPVVPLVDTDEIERRLKEYREIQMKNYAYDVAYSIMSAMGVGGGSSGSGGFLPLSGGSMTGLLSAKYGVELGDQGKLLVTITHDGNGDPVGYFNLPMQITGEVSLADTGIFFNKHQSIYIADQALNIDYQNVRIKGATEIDGTVKIGDISIDGSNGIKFGTYGFYHEGNSNRADVNWAAADLHVYKDLTVDGKVDVAGRFQALRGFDLGEGGNRYLYSSYGNGKGDIWLAADLTVLGASHGIRFGDHYVLRPGDTPDTISLSAPAQTLNLGDSEADPTGATEADGSVRRIRTASVALKTAFNTSDNLTTLITPDGQGYFLGFTATSCAAGDVVMSTFRKDSVDEGVLFPKRIVFKAAGGPAVFSDDGEALSAEFPYTFSDGTAPVTDRYEIKAHLIPTDSLWRNQAIATPTLSLGFGGQFFRFEQPVEAASFSPVSQKFKTRLEEGRLFLDENGTGSLFLQAVSNGIFHSGNALFNHSLSSQTFTSGMSGSGWAILEDALTGSFGATFDELTVRKKMRIYELEVQRQNVTNGSWWVTDACSGDTVEEIH